MKGTKKSGNIVSIAIALVLLVRWGVAADAAPAEARDWAFTRGNPEMTGVSPQELSLPLELGWSFATMPNAKGKMETALSSAVVKDGKVYAGNKEGKFYCLELATGKKVWESSAPKGSFEGAAGFSGQAVIAGCTDNYVYAWNAGTGQPLWRFQTEDAVRAAVNVWTDPKSGEERVFIGSYDYKLYCLNPKDGSKMWDVETGNYINGGCAVSKDGHIAFGGCDAVLHIHEAATGKEIRQIDVGANIANNIAIADGVAYVSHLGSRVAAFSLNDGARIWEYGPRDFEYYAAPAVWEKLAVVGGRDKRLHGIDRITGKGLWQFRCRDQIDSSAVICGGKQAVFGSDDGYLYVIETAKGTEAWSYLIGAAVKTSPAVAGGWVIVGADDGVIYAFKSAKKKP